MSDSKYQVSAWIMAKYNEYVKHYHSPIPPWNFATWLNVQVEGASQTTINLPTAETIGQKVELDKNLDASERVKKLLGPRIFSYSQWESLLSSSIASIQSLAAVKGGEYAGDSDRLANFRRNAAATGSSMELVWSIYYAKHHDAVMQYVKDLVSGTTRPRAEPLSGRVDDMIVYLLLLKAILSERGVK